MEKLDRVIEALEHCETLACNGCEYNDNRKGGWNCRQMHRDALDLLKDYKRKCGSPCMDCKNWNCDNVCDKYKKFLEFARNEQ